MIQKITLKIVLELISWEIAFQLHKSMFADYFRIISGWSVSAVPKRGRSRRSGTQKHTQMHANARKRAQKNAKELRTLRPLTAFKNAPNPKFVKNLSRRLFFGVPLRATEICQKFVENLRNDNFRTNFSKYRQFFDKFGSPWLEPRKNNGRDKFLTNLGFGAFLNAVRGKRARNKRAQTRKRVQKGAKPWKP